MLPRVRGLKMIFLGVGRVVAVRFWSEKPRQHGRQDHWWREAQGLESTECEKDNLCVHILTLLTMMTDREF